MNARTGIMVFCLLATAWARGSVIINEIHYNPDVKTDQVRFVELFNTDTNEINLSGWSFSQGISWVFPAGTTLSGRGYIVVAENPAALKNKFNATALGPFGGKLSAHGETITLRNAAGEVVNEVTYQLGFPWPTVGDAPGYSIELIHPRLDNNLGGSWRASVRDGATTNAPVQTLIPSQSQWKYFKGTQEPSTPTTAWRQLDFDDSAWLSGPAPIGYDSRDPMGTTLNDMRYNYTTLYVRKTFVVDDPTQIGTLLADILYDDGVNIWINTNHVDRLNLARDEMSYTDIALQTRENGNYETSVWNNAAAYLRPGTNVMAIQLHNIDRNTSTDAFIDLRLRAEPATSYANRGPTPGKANSVSATNAPPQIRQVVHTPNSPRAGESVVISAKITDPDGVTNVTLSLQLVDPGNYIELTDTAYQTNWLTVPLYDDGTHGDPTAADGTFSATLPSSLQIHRRLVRYRIAATDAFGLSITVPYADDPQPNFAYFVYSGVPAWTGSVQPNVTPPFTVGAEAMGRLPVYQLIAKSNAVATATWFSQYGGDLYPWAGTLVYDGKVYDHIHYRARGGVWRYAMVKNMWKFDLNRGHDLQARDNWGQKLKTTWTKLNLGASIQQGDYNHRGEQGMFESVGSRLFELAGVEAFKTSFVTLRIIDDAAEANANPQYEGDFWGVYLAVEQEDGRFLDEHGLPDANFYKMEGGTGTLNNLGPSGPTDRSDLNSLLANYSGASDSWWRANWNLPKFYSYQSIVQAIHHFDISDDKNYFYYRHPLTGLWEIMPWDLDLTWAHNMYRFDTGGCGVDRLTDRILAPIREGGVSLQSGTGVMRLSGNRPALEIEFRNRVREIRDLLFNTDQGWTLIDEYAALLRGPTNAPTILDADRAQWDYNPKMANSAYSSSIGKAGQGRFYQFPLESSTNSALRGSFDAAVALLKNYVVIRGEHLDNLARDLSIPAQPALAYLGPTNYPLNRLSFSAASFSGTYPLAAAKWRLAEITDPNSPMYSPADPWKYEIQTVWERLTNDYQASLTLPPAALKVAHRYRVRAQLIDNTGRASNWSAPYEFTAGEPDQSALLIDSLKITELMYQPLAGSDYEYLELFNSSTDTSLNLEGAIFTKGIDFTFGPGVTLAPQQYLVLTKTTNFALFRAYYQLDDSLLLVGPYSGSLDNKGETITLKTAANGAVIFSFTYDTGRNWPAAANGAGHSLTPWPAALATENQGSLDYGANWTASAVIGGSPGGPNPAPEPSLVINEIMAHTDISDPLYPGYDSNDWIELYNPTSEAITLVDGYLSDDPAQLNKWAIPTFTLPAFQWVSFDEITGFHQPLTSGFGLNKAGEKVFLSRLPGASADRVLDAVSFKGQANGASWARFPDGGPYWVTGWPTRGTNNQARWPEVIISEIHYHPTDLDTNDNVLDEFIELYNPNSQTITFSNTNGGWRIDGDVTFDFPVSTTLAPNKCLLLVNFARTNAAQLDAFKQQFQITNSSPLILGPYQGKLPNGAGRVALEKPQAGDLPTDPINWIIVDEVNYFDQAPWPPEADGAGFSLQRRSATKPGNNPANWLAAQPTAAQFAGPLKPVLSPLTWQSDGSPHFQIQGPSNTPFVVQATTNLVDWIPLLTNSTPDGFWEYVDPNWSLYLSRYYRVKIDE